MQKDTITTAQTLLREMAERYWFKFEDSGNEAYHAKYHVIHGTIKGLSSLELDCGHAVANCSKCAKDN